MSATLHTYDFKLPDMSCGHCVAAITRALGEVDDQAKLDFKRDTRELQVQSDLSREDLATALTEAGYPPAA
ncbi:copper chaperone [Paucibacter sp. KBW04]|uniref:heavy-metal-associated domain-containing protein n=1 Tax=Paucibacter sp. KBW04 TaxID=2153361 RepID=UPI000F56939E|nr:heavy-metal-associated domain-containing protein [Paucibacter sp. KBW04]RQO55616.1 copper chaperone [Paucibacter sp. KBW04]